MNWQFPITKLASIDIANRWQSRDDDLLKRRTPFDPKEKNVSPEYLQKSPDIIRRSALTDEQLDELVDHDTVSISGRVYVPYNTDARGVAWLVAADTSWYQAHEETPARTASGELPPIHGVPDTENYLRVASGADVEIEGIDG